MLADEEVYLSILKQFIDIIKCSPNFKIDMLCKSFNQPFVWDSKKNKRIYDEIKSLS